MQEKEEFCQELEEDGGQAITPSKAELEIERFLQDEE